jgi:hypothetical protein
MQGVLPWLKERIGALPGPAPGHKEGQATILRHFGRCSSLRTSADPWIIGRESAGRQAPRGTNKAVLGAVNLLSGNCGSR